MGRARLADDTGRRALFRRPLDLAVQSDPTPSHVLLDAHAGRGLASTILIARQLLDHDDLDEDQRQRIMGSLARSAATLAHHVLAAEAALAPGRESDDAA